MNEGRGGHWNRAGRQSGGWRPIPMTVGTREPTEAEQRDNARRDLFAGIRNGSPIWCIVAWGLAADGDEEVIAAMKRAGLGVPEGPACNT